MKKSLFSLYIEACKFYVLALRNHDDICAEIYKYDVDDIWQVLTPEEKQQAKMALSVIDWEKE
jgi:hypothetical protein